MAQIINVKAQTRQVFKKS